MYRVELINGREVFVNATELRKRRALIRCIVLEDRAAKAKAAPAHVIAAPPERAQAAGCFR